LSGNSRRAFGDAIRRIKDSEIEELIVTDTIPIAPERMISKSRNCRQSRAAIVRIHERFRSTMFDAMWSGQ
jgi:phosphoribosylpyrophosphate synthetase